MSEYCYQMSAYNNTLPPLQLVEKGGRLVASNHSCPLKDESPSHDLNLNSTVSCRHGYDFLQRN